MIIWALNKQFWDEPLVQKGGDQIYIEVALHTSKWMCINLVTWKCWYFIIKWVKKNFTKFNLKQQFFSWNLKQNWYAKYFRMERVHTSNTSICTCSFLNFLQLSNLILVLSFFWTPLQIWGQFFLPWQIMFSEDGKFSWRARQIYIRLFFCQKIAVLAN